MIEYISLAVSLVSLVCVIILLLKKSKPTEYNDSQLRGTIESTLQTFGKVVTNSQREIGNIQTERFGFIDRAITDMRVTVDRRLDKMREDTTAGIDRLRAENTAALEKLRSENTHILEKMREDNGIQLEKMRATVDEKLQSTLETRLSRSFKLVSERLEQVYKGLGEMQTLAQGVGDLKKVLSNVKTRGILGEIQLGAIIEQIMSPEQYSENVATIPGSKNVVEFAVKLPDRDGNITYLPIDSKFPGDTYAALLDAYDTGDKSAIDTAAKQLRSRILNEAKDIHTKYVSPPYTTDFAVMFLPFEGLYAEAVNRGLVEELQSSYRIMIAGPSTMAALLNSIQMGFKTLAIEKRSAEVWNVLGAVKTEFEKFDKILQSTQKRINQANEELDKLIGVRTRAIVRKLGSVEKTESTDLLFDTDTQDTLTDDD